MDVLANHLAGGTPPHQHLDRTLDRRCQSWLTVEPAPASFAAIPQPRVDCVAWDCFTRSAAPDTAWQEAACDRRAVEAHAAADQCGACPTNPTSLDSSNAQSKCSLACAASSVRYPQVPTHRCAGSCAGVLPGPPLRCPAARLQRAYWGGMRYTCRLWSHPPAPLRPSLLRLPPMVTVEGRRRVQVAGVLAGARPRGRRARRLAGRPGRQRPDMGQAPWRRAAHVSSRLCV